MGTTLQYTELLGEGRILFFKASQMILISYKAEFHECSWSYKLDILTPWTPHFLVSWYTKRLLSLKKIYLQPIFSVLILFALYNDASFKSVGCAGIVPPAIPLFTVPDQYYHMLLCLSLFLLLILWPATAHYPSNTLRVAQRSPCKGFPRVLQHNWRPPFYEYPVLFFLL